VQHDEVAEVRVKVELRHAAVARAATRVVLREDGDEAVLQLLGDVAGDVESAGALWAETAGGSPEVHEVAAARRALDLEVLAVVLVEALQRLDHAVVMCERERSKTRRDCTHRKLTASQTGPRQLLLPPNIGD
jgi:hypothetical protein